MADGVAVVVVVVVVGDSVDGGGDVGVAKHVTIELNAKHTQITFITASFMMNFAPPLLLNNIQLDNLGQQ